MTALRGVWVVPRSAVVPSAHHFSKMNQVPVNAYYSFEEGAAVLPCRTSSRSKARRISLRTCFLSALHRGAIRPRFAPSPVRRWITMSGGTASRHCSRTPDIRFQGQRPEQPLSVILGKVCPFQHVEELEFDPLRPALADIARRLDRHFGRLTRQADDHVDNDGDPCGMQPFDGIVKHRQTLSAGIRAGSPSPSVHGRSEGRVPPIRA